MSIVFVDGKFISVAKVGCPKCKGSGIALERQSFHPGFITVSAKFCDCIEIKIVEAAHDRP